MTRISGGYVAAGLFAGLITGCTTVEPVIAPDRYAAEPFPVRVVDRKRFDAAYRPATVANETGEPSGTIVVDTARKQLVYVLNERETRRWGIAVGATGKAWTGTATIGRKAKWPTWYPTDDMRNQTPDLPRRIEPGSHNPLGARALYLYQDGVDTLYRIHGTSEPWTIGTEASSGCIRMVNEDVIELYELAKTGDRVVVR